MKSDRGDWDTAALAMDHCAGDDLYTQAGRAYGAFVFWVERLLPLNALRKMGICSVSWDLHFGATFAGGGVSSPRA